MLLNNMLNDNFPAAGTSPEPLRAILVRHSAAAHHADAGSAGVLIELRADGVLRVAGSSLLFC
jgi:hypothetical protein